MIIIADVHLVEGLMRNLLSNAVELISKVKITVSAKSVSDLCVEISIKDTGIGMNKRIVDNLFCLGGQTTRRGAEGEPSTGLGLIICKEFVEKHDGKIWVESEEGKGREVRFVLQFHL
ncbi:MAG: ATP-binding protein [Bacteroidota bacterium]